MSSKSFRIDCNITLDSSKEADIIKVIDKLKSSHKLGQFITHLIQLSINNPELLDNNSYSDGETLKKLSELGISYNRNNFFNYIEKEVASMKDKIDSMYSLVLKTYMLGQIGKTLGIDEKAENELLAQFVIEKQFKEIQEIVGVDLKSDVLASNKLADVKKIGEDTLEYVIESYSGLINELKKLTVQQQEQVVVVQQPVVKQEQPVKEVVVQQPVQVAQQPQKEVQKSQPTNTEETSDEAINFDNADLLALSNFFGD